MKKNEIRDKVLEIAEDIRKTWYLSPENLRIEESYYNDVIIISELTFLVRGNQLLVGSYGWGKTTLPEALSAYFLGIPPRVVMTAEIKGHPFLTPEQAIGRPDLGKLQKGEEKVIWSNFSKVLKYGIGVVDEINRIPEGMQNSLLDVIDRGNVAYLSEALVFEKPAFYATMNYRDEGNAPLIPPLEDRFGACVEVTPPLNSDLLLTDYAERKKEEFRHRDIERKMIETLEEKNLENFYKKFDDLRKEYMNYLDGKGIPVIYEEEIKDIRRYLDEVISLHPETKTFLAFVFSGVNSVIKVEGEPNLTEHYEKTPFGNNLSYRWLKSVAEYAKAMAFLCKNKKVTTENVLEVMPYTLQHRLRLSDKFGNSEIKPEHFPGSQQRYATMRWCEEVYEYWNENKDVYEEFLLREAKGGDLKIFEDYDLPQIRAALFRRNTKNWMKR